MFSGGGNNLATAIKIGTKDDKSVPGAKNVWGVWYLAMGSGWVPVCLGCSSFGRENQHLWKMMLPFGHSISLLSAQTWYAAGFGNKQDCTGEIGKFCFLVSPRKRDVLIPWHHHLCSLISQAEYILHLFLEKEITVLQILTSVTCIHVLMICRRGRSYSLEEPSQRILWPLSKRHLMVPAEAFAVHAMARLDLGKNTIKHLTQKQIGRGGRSGCLFWGIC